MRFQAASGMLEGVTSVAPVVGVFNSTADSSNKTFTVPGGEMWELLWAHITLVTTATVGNRQMEMRVFDASSNLMLSVSAGAVQAASLTRDYHYMPGTFRETAFVANELQVPFASGLHLPAGWSVNFRDSAAIAAAADDMTVAFQYKQYKGMS